MSDNDNDTWLPVSEAAQVLGVSERTIWRRVRAGKLPIDRSVTPHLVGVSDVDSDAGMPEGDIDSDRVTELEGKILELQRKIERLAADNQELEAQTGRLQDVLDEVRSERDYLRQAHAASLSTQQRLLEAQMGRRSWIERLLPWMKGGDAD